MPLDGRKPEVSLSRGPDLDFAVEDLAAAEGFYWATLDDPYASEADRIEAAENLDRAQTLMQELVAEPLQAEAQSQLEAEI
jgi:hypothetical protein